MLAAWGKFVLKAYRPSNDMAGLRNTVIAKAHATNNTGNTQRKAAVGEPKATKAGMAMNKDDAKTTPTEMKGKRVAIQR